jgi:molecular chaperone HtpG
MAEQHVFQAEIKQLLHILVHSLYTDREIFLRELISNAADALSKMQFLQLTEQAVLDADSELYIEVYADPAARQVRIVDTGLGMTHDDLMNNLGVIAQSGVKGFLEQMQQAGDLKQSLIGQFGVGFYSVFMVAEHVEVISRSYQPTAEAYRWASDGGESYTLEPAEKTTRGTEIIVHLREAAAEFADGWRLREIIKRHSDYVSFPIYLIQPAPEGQEEGEAAAQQTEAENKPVNQQTALWRRPAGEISPEDYDNFYRSLTLDFEPPALRIHTQSDAPIQYYALLFLPKKREGNMFSLRKQPGLKLYARKVLIQEYNADLLPDYLQFVQGVVDSEDIPLSVSRETVQTNPHMAKLKQVLKRKVLSELAKLAKNEAEAYIGFWEEMGPYLKQGVITDYEDREKLLPLLRFQSSHAAGEWTGLEDYAARMEGVEGQEAIYYLIADNAAAASHSPHLDPFRERGIEVLFLTDSMDGFMVNSLRDYKGHKLLSVDVADLDLSGVGQAAENTEKPADAADLAGLVAKMKGVLGEAVSDVRVSKVLGAGSAVRLVTPEGSLDRHTQRVYQMLEKDFQAPARILEVNPRHRVIHNLLRHLGQNAEGPQVQTLIQVLYGNALMADGIHPNPAEFVRQVQNLLELASE